MRKILSIVLPVFCCLNVYAQTNYPNGVTGCIARWNFTNSGTITSLPDVSGNNNNGTVYNLVTANGFRELVNKSMRFNGTSSYSLVSSNAMLGPSQITMISVVKLHEYNAATCQTSEIISKGYPHFIAGNWGMGLSDNIYDAGDCNTYNPDKTQLVAQFYNANSNPPTAGNYVDTAKWYFLACSYDGNTVKYYMTEMDTNTYHTTLPPIYTVGSLATAIGTNAQDVSIGHHLNPSYPYWLNGDMDEMTLFNRALSDSEVHSVYTYLWGQLTLSTPDTASPCDSITVSYTTYNPDIFQAGNVFTVQLSNASGSFASPVDMGSVASVTSGTITCAIPPTTPTGTGYRIRIVASNSHFISPDNGTNIHIYPAPGLHPNISRNGMILSLLTSYTNYQWYYNGSPINPGGTNPTYTVSLSGTYYVRVTNSNGCTGYSDTITVFATGVYNLGNTNKNISIYPNPAKNILYLSYLNVKDGSITITDIAGRTLITEPLANSINISKLAKGIYMCRISEGDEVIWYSKIVKE